MSRSRYASVPIAANLTPMIDVVFLLIVFFVLVSQVVDLQSVHMDLPAPLDPASEMAGDDPRAVINIVPSASGSAAGYRLGSRFYAADTAGVQALAGHLAGLYRDAPTLRVNLRADRTTHYQWVQPALEAVADAAREAGHDVIPALNLVVVREP